MIINRKKLLSLGFKVLGSDTNSQKVLYSYVKYYEDALCLLIADSRAESLYGFKFASKEDMQDFRDGKYAITKDRFMNKRNGVDGKPYKYIPSIELNGMLNIDRISIAKHLTDGIALFENKYVN